MMADIVRTPQTQADLEAILEYLEERSPARPTLRVPGDPVPTAPAVASDRSDRSHLSAQSDRLRL
jgi:hypothetical protein